MADGVPDGQDSTATAESNGSSAETPTPVDWKQDRRGRWITPARGRSGVVYRQGNETVEEAHARDAKGPKDQPPKSKRSKVPKGPAPTQRTLVELEAMLVETFQAPAFVAAARGDQWAVQHFYKEAPVLARNLTVAAEHNPWLRAKLEAVLTGGTILTTLLTLVPVAGALVAYSIPPVIYYLDPGFIPPGAREMFKVPERPKKPKPTEEQDAAPAEDAAPAGTAIAA